jgi:hypothetical protein
MPLAGERAAVAANAREEDMRAPDIDEVIGLLDGLIAGYRERQSTLAYFACLYRAVTLRVRSGIEQGAFEDGERMNRFDTDFGNRYFAALDAAASGHKPPKAWLAAFAAEARPKTTIVQHLLLGVNAHINFDLPFAAVAAAPGSALPGLRNDYLAINTILARTFAAAQSVIDEFSPLLHVLDQVGGRTDAAIATFSIETAREEAWHEATRLAIESGAQLERAARSLDRRAALLAETIILPGGLLGLAFELIASSESTKVTSITDALLAIP